MKKQQKKMLFWGIVIIAIIGSFFIFKAPDYPDTITPKPIQGNPAAAVRLVEYADYQCPACGAAHPSVKRIVEEFKENVSYEFKHFPISSIHPYAQLAAEAAECANDQGKFVEYGDMLFSNQNRLGRTDLIKYAEALSLDIDSFKACLGSGKKGKIVSGEYRQGLAAGVSGTPTIFLNGKPIASWQYDTFKQEILNALN
ncbi:DsbA family protein [Candidatus Woesearchaeota archaeon]|nr:DsbA family protein [Candidatus Woesearchaeota archaeon]